MRSISPVYTVAAIISLTIVSGIVHGMLSNRWGPPADLLKAGESLEASFPKKIGDWEMQSEDPISDVVAEVLQVSGSILRTYVNTSQAQPPVRISVLVGPSGPISVHRPEIRYSARDYGLERERKAKHIEASDSSEGDFWTLTLQPNDLNGRPLLVYYAWTADGTWQAAESPRVSMSDHKILYKIQLAADAPTAIDTPRGTEDSDPCANFLAALLAESNPLGLEQ